jgi:hypothetical protein
VGTIVQKFLSNQITAALFRHGLSHDSRVRDDLEARAEVCGAREAAVRVCDESGRSISLDDRLGQLRHDPKYSDCFPAELPRVSRQDEKQLRDNFERIARGDVLVE